MYCMIGVGHCYLWADGELTAVTYHGLMDSKLGDGTGLRGGG